MNARSGFYILFTLWVLAWSAGFVAFTFTEPTGDSFLHGMNRVMSFFVWQMLATLLAAAIWMAGRKAGLTGSLKWLARLPVLLAVAMMLGLIALIFAANLSHPEPGTGTPKPVTLPLD